MSGRGVTVDYFCPKCDARVGKGIIMETQTSYICQNRECRSFGPWRERIKRSRKESK